VRQCVLEKVRLFRSAVAALHSYHVRVFVFDRTNTHTSLVVLSHDRRRQTDRHGNNASSWPVRKQLCFVAAAGYFECLGQLNNLI